MEKGIFWKTFENTGKVLDYLHYKYEEDASFVGGETNTYQDGYRSIYSSSHPIEALTGEEQKWKIQSQ